MLGSIVNREAAPVVLGTSALFGAYALIADALSQQPIDSPLRALVTLVLPLLVAPGVVAVAHVSMGKDLPRRAKFAVRSVKAYVALLTVILIVGAGLLAFIVPGIVAAILLVYAVPAAAVDGATPVQAAVRSTRLTRRRFWDAAIVLAVIVTAIALAAVVAGAGIVATSTIGGHPLLGTAIGGSLGGAVSSWAIWWLVGEYEQRSSEFSSSSPAR